MRRATVGWGGAMPKSRGRRPKKQRARKRPGRPMKAEDYRDEMRLVVVADAAEARGDVAGALDVMTSHPLGPDGRFFWRRSRVSRLLQIQALQPVLPRWATSRWILEQALQCLDAASRGAGLAAIDIAIETRGGPDTLYGVDDAYARAKVMDDDWVYRQVFLYELGGLRRFLHGGAAADLVAGADRIHDWANASMGGFELLGETSRDQTWRELASRAELTLVNLGFGTLLDPGDCVIGRVVPVEGGAMFETAPLPVPEDLARRIAAAPASWQAALTEARREPHPDVCTFGLHDFGLLTDVPEMAWRARAHLDTCAACGEGDVCQGPQSTGGMLGEAVALVLSALARVRAGATVDTRCDASIGPCVAAALAEPLVADLFGSCLQESDRVPLIAMADQLAEPAASLCRWLADGLKVSA